MAAPPQVRVRDAETGDLPAVQAIYGHHVRHGLASFEEEPPSLDEIGRRFAAVHAAGLPYLAAEAPDGNVIGYAYAGQYRPRPGYRFSLEDSVYVAPGGEGRGVGRALLSELLARCTGLGYRQMVAIIGDSANLASIRLHESQGFAMMGTLRSIGFKHGRWVDSVLMQRALGEGDDTLPAGPPTGRAA